MDITAGALGCAYLTDWEQECCGGPIAAGAIHELLLQPSAQGRRSLSHIPVDWILTHHDDGGSAESTPLRRVRAQVRNVREVWPNGRLSETNRVPGRADLAEPPPAEEPVTGVGGFASMGACEPVLPETPRPEAWLLELEILADLGPHTW